nr:hypothetical protein fc94 [uncultured bacterium]
MDPVLRREVVERQQLDPILLQTLDRRRVFGLVHRYEVVEGPLGVGPRGQAAVGLTPVKPSLVVGRVDAQGQVVARAEPSLTCRSTSRAGLPSQPGCEM